jgi:hypothetical protein
MAYFKRRKRGEPKTIPLNAEAQRAIQEQLRGASTSASGPSNGLVVSWAATELPLLELSNSQR